MPRKPKRDPGEKNPQNFTKMEIIKFLFQGKKSTTEIRGFLEEEHNITEYKNIKKHLADLIEMEILEKEERTRGGVHYYSIRTDYLGFRSLFLFYKQGEMELEFLSTDYAQSMITPSIYSGIISQLVNGFFKPIVTIASADQEEIDADPAVAALAEAFKSDPEMAEQLESFKAMEEVLSFPSPSDMELWMENDPVIREFIVGLIFPGHEKMDLLEMIRASPSSVNFLVTLGEDYHQMMILFNSYLKYILTSGQVMGLIGNLPSMEDIEAVEGIDHELIRKEFIDELQSHDRQNPSPMFIIVKSLLIWDIFNHNVHLTDWLSEFYIDLFVESDDWKCHYKSQIPEVSE